jgi:hypothetical protein
VIHWIQSHKSWLAWLAVLSAVTLIASALLIPWLVARVPADYFARGRHHTPWQDKHPIVRIFLVIAKNLFGLILVGLGILMLVLPGQGILTIVAGIALIDFPGRHAAVHWLVCKPPVLKSLNWLRKRARREPLRV